MKFNLLFFIASLTLLVETLWLLQLSIDQRVSLFAPLVWFCFRENQTSHLILYGEQPTSPASGQYGLRKLEREVNSMFVKINNIPNNPLLSSRFCYSTSPFLYSIAYPNDFLRKIREINVH